MDRYNANQTIRRIEAAAIKCNLDYIMLWAMLAGVVALIIRIVLVGL